MMVYESSRLMAAATLCLLVVLGCLIERSEQHGFMLEPPSRSSAWLVDPDFVDCCKNYDYNQMFCGGIMKQWELNGGRCGICGDPWDQEGPRSFEKGGDHYLGKIVRTYNVNTVIPVTIKITANHKGFFEFRLCNVDNMKTDATQACLNRTVLQIVNTNMPENSKKYRVFEELRTAELTLAVPLDFTCRHCVLQWKYVAGNSWGVDPDTGKGCVGCGPVQEHFFGCADIAIKDPNKPEEETVIEEEPVSTTEAANIINEPIVNNAESSEVIEAVIEVNGPGLENQTTIHGHSSSSSQEADWSNDVSNNNSTVYNGCSSKLEFGPMMNIGRVVSIYCYRMCKVKCDELISSVPNVEELRQTREKDYLVCFQTCPVLCSC